MTAKKLRFVRPDVAIVDIDTRVSGGSMEPLGVQVGLGGALHSCLLIVLVKESGEWWIAAYHNVWGSMAPPLAASAAADR
jgi:hypothetical protein